jgi:hypothetical protein
MKSRAASTSRRPPENMQRQPPQNMQRQPPQNMQRQPPQNMQRQQQPQITEKPKISISDAIGLTTIRVSRIEQFISKLQENGDYSTISPFSDNHNTNNANSDVFEIINTRLNSLEQLKIHERLLKCETDLTDTKDLLIKLVLKHEKLSSDINSKLTDLIQMVTSHDTYILEQKTDILEQQSEVNEPEEPESLNQKMDVLEI